MRITIESTDTLTSIEGVPVRLWEGTTESGIKCRVFVRMIAVRNDEDSAPFERELKELDAPRDMKGGVLVIPLREIL